MRYAVLLGSVISVLGFSAVHAQASVILEYTNFSSTSGLTLVGSAGTASTDDGRVLRLTPAAGGQGAAYSNTAVALGTNATFSTQFQFRFTNPRGVDPADGITFVLASNPNGLGRGGVGMGYAGVPNSIAIEFDTYNNGNANSLAFFPQEPNSSNHVAIDTNGVLQNSAPTNVYGNSSCGFPTGTPAQNDYLADGCMSNGHLWTATISYDGSFLSVSLLDPVMDTTFLAINQYPIDISSLLGTTNAYAGFTASTGAGSENHDVVNWKLENTPITPIPEPASLMLAAAGLIAFMFVRLRFAGYRDQ